MTKGIYQRLYLAIFHKKKITHQHSELPCVNQTKKISNIRLSKYQTSGYQNIKHQTTKYQTSGYQIIKHRDIYYQISDYQISNIRLPNTKLRDTNYKTSGYQLSNVGLPNIKYQATKISNIRLSIIKHRDTIIKHWDTSYRTSDYQISDYKLLEATIIHKINIPYKYGIQTIPELPNPLINLRQ